MALNVTPTEIGVPLSSVFTQEWMLSEPKTLVSPEYVPALDIIEESVWLQLFSKAAPMKAESIQIIENRIFILFGIVILRSLMKNRAKNEKNLNTPF